MDIIYTIQLTEAQYAALLDRAAELEIPLEDLLLQAMQNFLEESVTTLPEMKGITVKIPADLHAEVKAYLEAHGMTMGEFIAQAVDNELHPKIQITQEDKNMERMRTLAFQETFILTQRPQEDSTENDVEENVAAEYGMGQQL